MHLDDTPFAQIASGVKTMELRLHDEKRRKMRQGDHITFVLRSQPEKTLHVTICELIVRESFSKLLKDFAPEKYLDECMSRQDILKEIQKWYSSEDEKDNGVVGIIVKRI